MKKGKINSIIGSKNKEIGLEAEESGFFREIFGLMFSKRENAKAIFFDFGKKTKIALHSWFVFFPFLAVWLDDKNRIIETRIVKPFEFNIKPKKTFSKVIEIPFNDNYKKIIKKIVGKKKHLNRFYVLS